MVAELASCHEGNKHLAAEMVRQLAGHADIVKLQFGHRRDDPLRYVGREFAEYARGAADFYGCELMASIFSDEGLDLARHLGMQRYKIAHQTFLDESKTGLVSQIIADGRETFISRHVSPTERPSNVRWIFVHPKYPADPEDGMPDWFDDFYGYSSHLRGPEACVLAAARGAQYLEAHVTLNKASQSLRDHAFALSPAEFADMARHARAVSRLLEAM